MNKLINIFVCLFIISCIPQKNIVNKTKHSILYIEDHRHLIAFRFNNFVSNRNSIINNKKLKVFIGGDQVDMLSAGKYEFIFISENNDTMNVKSILNFNYNYYFDDIKFKKGSYKLEYNIYDRNDKRVLKGERVFSRNEALLNTKIVFFSRDYFSQETFKDTIFNDTIWVKDVKFDYYDFKQKDFTLEKIND